MRDTRVGSSGGEPCVWNLFGELDANQFIQADLDRIRMKFLKLIVVGVAFFAVEMDSDTADATAALPPHRDGVQRVTFDSPALPPMAFTKFCLRYAGECKPQRMRFRDGRMTLTPARRAELNSVNTGVNSAIHPRENQAGLVKETWLIDPPNGDCNDYAVSKRHALIAMGWAPASLLLSEVVIATGQHHLVVIVRTDRDDLVLDNLSADILPWSRKPFVWLRMQTPANANYWSTLAGAAVL